MSYDIIYFTVLNVLNVIYNYYNIYYLISHKLNMFLLPVVQKEYILIHISDILISNLYKIIPIIGT